MTIVGGRQPDLTPVQLLSAVPVIAGLAAGLGGWDPTDGQSRIVRSAMLWSSALVLADAVLRVGRGAWAQRSAANATPVGPGDFYDEDDLEPVPGGDDFAELLETELDPELTKPGVVADAAGKPADYR